MKTRRGLESLIFGVFVATMIASDNAGGPEMPLVYEGPGLPSPQSPDGGVRYNPSVQNIQVYRGTRKRSSEFRTLDAHPVGYTYNHHPDIACWKGKFYVAWGMGLKDEDIPPSQVMYATSSDGFNWSAPRNLFPPEMGWSLRFYFYLASNGRMLVFASGPYHVDTRVSEKDKSTLLVRELISEDRLGDVYTLVNPGPGYPPAYTQSSDVQFLAACHEVLNHRLVLEQQDYGVFLGDRRMKWHFARNWPGGKVQGNDDYWTFGKAQCFFHRSDGALIGLSKLGFVTESRDDGATWSLPVVAKGLDVAGAKEWGQKTPDGRYVMVYPPAKGTRYPMVLTTSDDGITFGNMRLVHGDVPPQRYEGKWKDMGPQYLRGVAEWAGDSPTLDPSAIWVAYSVNKEDIWVSRIPVPVISEDREPLRDTFERATPGLRVPGWNTYSPAWAPVRIARARDGQNQFMEFTDREPVDYARAVRTFPAMRVGSVSFRVAAEQTHGGRLEIDLLDEQNTRPVRLVLDEQGRLRANRGAELTDLGSYVTGDWAKFTIQFGGGKYTLVRDGQLLVEGGAYANPAALLYAVSFRTGEYRNAVSTAAKVDLPDTEDPVKASGFQIDDVIAREPAAAP
jgi:hypothetical protein